MDTGELEQAYRELLDVCAQAAAAGFRAPADRADWTAEQILAHVAAIDRLLLAGTAAVLGAAVPEGRPTYDDSPALVLRALDVLARAAGDLADLVGTVRQTGRELVLLARRLPESAAVQPVRVRLSEGAADPAVPRLDGPVPWRGVLAAHAQVHLPDHTAQLRELRRR